MFTSVSRRLVSFHDCSVQDVGLPVPGTCVGRTAAVWLQRLKPAETLTAGAAPVERAP